MDIALHCIIAFTIRLGFVIFGSIQDAYFEVKYTDVDYHVFTDAARYIVEGRSPFNRHTYRYTPLLALMLVPNIFVHSTFGKLLFSSFDVLTGLSMYHILKKYRVSEDACRRGAFLWLYNPVCIVIATRGSAESLVTSLVMLCILFYQYNHLALFGIAYGFAVHIKLYPCIYAITFYTILSSFPHISTKWWTKLYVMLYPTRPKIIFATYATCGFAIPTALCYVFCGEEYIGEGFMYHLTRKDKRHNFSPYFYVMYLCEAGHDTYQNLISVFGFAIQALLVFLPSFVFCTPRMLPACLFTQTFVFVAFNKVCTSQYFIWYLCMFPLCYSLFDLSASFVLKFFVLWILGQVLWLIPAYCLEFKGTNMFIDLWLSCLFFLAINAYLISEFIKIVAIKTHQQIVSKKAK